MSFLIAEVKTQSPFGYKSNRSFDYLKELACEYGDMISVHTDPRWNGNFDLLKRARNWTNKPILAKGIHATDDDIQKAIDYGADKVLVVGRIPAKKYLSYCYIEPNTLEELATLPSDISAVWNSRDLENGGLKKAAFGDAKAIFKGNLIQASNIKSPADVCPDSYAHIVGQNLENYLSSL